LGWGTPEDVSEVAGGSVGADALADLVPLVRRDAEGRLHAPQLWEEATERIFVDVERGPLRRRALDLFARRGETMRLGWSAVQWRDGAALRVAARALARDTLGALPVQTAGRWIAQAPPDVLDAPEIRLLGLAVRQARGEVDPSMDGEIDVLATSFVGEGDQEGRAVALAIGAVIAYGRGDHLRLLHITSTFDDDVDAVRLPLLTFLSGAVAAAFASFSGDADAVLEILESLSYDDVPAEVTELVVRLHATMLALSGRADDAAALAGRLERSHDAHVRWLPSHFRWLAFDVDVEIDERAATPASGEINERDQFFHASQIAAIAASRGDLAVVRRYLPMVVAMAARADARDATIGVMATVLCQVADHDEGAAERSLAAHLSRYPLKEPLCERHLRRHLAVSYLLAEGAAEHWDEQPLGPLHERTRSAARLLAELRRGAVADDGRLPQPEVVMTSLPLPWSVELAVRAHADGVVGAFDLAHRLGEWEPAAAARELARWSSDDSLPASLVESARVLATAVAACTSPTVHVEVLGPLRVTVGGDALDAPDLRRSRVRTLLELLAVCGPIDRDRVIELIWPDAEPAAARQNLRVTLTRLRRALLAPGVPSTTPMVLADGDDLALASPPTLAVDLDRFRSIVAEADRRRDDGDTAATVVSLHEAFDLWRGTALADLEEVAGLASEVDEARREVVDVGLRLGEALLVAGVFDAALRCAVRCRSASRYDERAHRLAIAANVHRQDHAGVQSAVGVLHEALAELGVEPQPSTMMLLRRAGEFSR
jgi:DNA-binding SARP family transcriptional activator